MAKNVGKQFEDDFSNSFKDTSHFYLRLVDAMKWGSGQGSRFTPTNPADCIMCAYPVVFALELKSTDKTSFSYELVKEKGKKTTPMIKAKQIADLKKLYEENAGVIAGFVFNLRPRELKTIKRDNQVWFVHIKDFLDIAETKGTKGSISEDDIAKVGVLVEGEQKKIHYKYNIDKFANDVVQRCLIRNYLKREFLEDIKNWIEHILTWTPLHMPKYYKPQFEIKVRKDEPKWL